MSPPLPRPSAPPPPPEPTGGWARRRGAAAALALLLLAASGSLRDGRVRVVAAPGAAAAASGLAAPGPDAPAAPAPAPAAALEVHVVDEAGAARAGARVRAEREDDAAVHVDAEADAGGVARFAALAPGRWIVRADAEGGAPAGGVWRVPASEPLTLTVRAAGRVGGLVLAPDGLPAAGAEVAIVGSGVWPERVERAGEDGRFSIDGVPPGVYEVSARSGAARAEPRRGLAVEAGARVVLTFALAAGAALAGLVVDAASGAPIAGARVRVGSAALSLDARTATSGADGRFSVGGLAPGAGVFVEGSADGFVSASASACSPGALCTLRLEPAASVAGVVLDEEARPVEGAAIEIVGEGSFGRPVRLRAEGAGIAASGVPGRLPVTAEVPPLPLFSAEGSGARPLRVASAVPGAGGHGVVRTNARGEFVVEGVPAGTLEVVARAAGHAAGRSAPLRIAPGERRENVEIVVGQGGRIEGSVLDEDGEGVAGAVLEHRSELDPSPRITLTDAQGRFELDGLRGEVTLRAMAAGRPPVSARVEVDAGATTTATLRLDPAGLVLSGRVVDARGRAIDGAQVRIESMRPGGGLVRTVVTDAVGGFVAERVPAPPLRVVCDHRSYAITAGLDVEALEVPVEVVLSRAIEVRGSVLDAWTGLGVERAGVRLVSAAVPPVVRSVETDEAGAFVVPRVGAGGWTLEVVAEGYVRAVSSIAVRERRWDEASLEPVALEPGVRVEGDVVDRLGRVVSGVLVRVAEEGEDAPRARTDERGHFVLGGLGPGPHRVEVEHVAAGAQTVGVEVARGREPASLVVHLPGRADAEAMGAPAFSPRRGVPLEVGFAAGAVVVVAAHGGLAASGVRPGDVLVAVDGEPVPDPARAEVLLRGSGPAVLSLVRGGEPFYLRADRRRWAPP